jgi:hypothetical protein
VILNVGRESFEDELESERERYFRAAGIDRITLSERSECRNNYARDDMEHHA